MAGGSGIDAPAEERMSRMRLQAPDPSAPQRCGDGPLLLNVQN